MGVSILSRIHIRLRIFRARRPIVLEQRQSPKLRENIGLRLGVAVRFGWRIDSPIPDAA